MNSINPTSEVLDDEWLARYIFSSRHFRPSDLTVRPEAFSPPSSLEFSVSRHLERNEEELWKTGRAIGRARPDSRLYGRADLQAISPRSSGLNVKSAPMLDDNGHAVLVGWPPDKASQKIIQLELARSAKFIPNRELE